RFERRQLDRQWLAAHLRALAFDHVGSDLAHLGGLAAGGAAPLGTRQQQQRLDQFGGLARGALDPLQPLAQFLGEVGRALQQFGGAGDYRQRRAQFVADIGIELAVALDHRSEPGRILIQRMRKFAHLVLGKVRRQRLGLAGSAEIAQSVGQVADRLENPTRQPQADRQRKQAEQQDRADQRQDQLLLAQVFATDVVASKTDDAILALHCQLVVSLAATLVYLIDVVNAALEVLPSQRHFVQGALALHPALYQF